MQKLKFFKTFKTFSFCTTLNFQRLAKQVDYFLISFRFQVTMFMAHGKDGILSADEDPERICLISSEPSVSIYEDKRPSSFKKYFKGSIKIPKTQAVAGILLGYMLIVFSMRTKIFNANYRLH